MAKWTATDTGWEFLLGMLGDLFVHRDPDGLHSWGLCNGPRFIFCCEDRYADPEAAKRKAIAWAQRAVRQAAKKLDV